jgi:hypothetical protein
MPWSRNTLWRQGSVLTRKDFESLGLADTDDADLAVAISHDCDIANDDLDAESSVEFIFGRILAQQDGNYTYGKNPRTLHIAYMYDGKLVSFELIASQKLLVKKNKLEAIQPDETYQLTESRQILQSWLAARYRRHALPNSLVDRLRPVFLFIEKKGKKNSSGILSFQLSYEPEYELPPEEPYELWISIVYIIDKTEYGAMAESVASDLNTEFSNLLEKTKKNGTVDLRECKAISEMEFTLRDMRETVEYHLEYVSYRTDPSGPLI